MTDVAIIGKGPAGLSAAMTLRLRGLSAMVLSPALETGWLSRAEQILNYPGLPETSGAALLHAFEEQARALGVNWMRGVVRQVQPTPTGYMLLCGNEIVEARAVILASGTARPKPLAGETERVGAGVSYCATCDGMFYRGREVAVLSETAEGAEEARFLAGVAKRVAYFPLHAHDAGALPDNVTVHAEKPLEIADAADGRLLVRTAQGDFAADGVFVFRPAAPLDRLLPDLQTDGGFVRVDRAMRTNVAGVFAAGDVTGKPLQIAKAVGEGNIAALSAADYLTKLA